MPDWGDRGTKLVTSGADFVMGMTGAIKTLGTRLKRSRYKDFIESLCAIVGDISKQNGELLEPEKKAFKDFVIQNRNNVPAFSSFDPDELVTKMTDYAVLSFLGKHDKIILAIKGIEPDSDIAKLIIIASILVAGADGEIDNKEMSRIIYYSSNFSIDLKPLLNKHGGDSLELKNTPQIENTPISCSFCQGKGCMMCK